MSGHAHPQPMELVGNNDGEDNASLWHLHSLMLAGRRMKDSDGRMATVTMGPWNVGEGQGACRGSAFPNMGILSSGAVLWPLAVLLLMLLMPMCSAVSNPQVPTMRGSQI